MEELDLLRRVEAARRAGLFVAGGIGEGDETGKDDGTETGEGETEGGEGETEGEQGETQGEGETGEEGEGGEGDENAAGKQAAPADKEKRDPTAGMTDAQRAHYWERRAKDYAKDMHKFKGQVRGSQQQPAKLGDALRVQEEREKAAPEKKALADMTPEEFQQDTFEKAKNAARAELVMSQRRERMIESEAAAREKYDGKDGRLNYDEVFDEHVKPFIDENPWVIKILLASKDAGEAAMGLAALLEPSLARQMHGKIQRQAREDLVDNINKASRAAVTIKSGRAGQKHTTKKTAADYNAMSDADLEAEADAVINGMTD